MTDEKSPHIYLYVLCTGWIGLVKGYPTKEFYKTPWSHNALFCHSQSHSVNHSTQMLIEYFWESWSKVALWECCEHAYLQECHRNTIMLTAEANNDRCFSSQSWLPVSRTRPIINLVWLHNYEHLYKTLTKQLMHIWLHPQMCTALL